MCCGGQCITVASRAQALDWLDRVDILQKTQSNDRAIGLFPGWDGHATACRCARNLVKARVWFSWITHSGWTSSVHGAAAWIVARAGARDGAASAVIVRPHVWPFVRLLATSA